MHKIKYTVIPVIVCFVVAFSGILPVSALTSEDMIQRESWQASFEGVDVANSGLRFSTTTDYISLNADAWRIIALGKTADFADYVRLETINGLGSYMASSADSDYSLWSGVPYIYYYDVVNAMDNRVMRVPLNFQTALIPGAEKYFFNNFPFQPALNYCVQFKVVIRCASNNNFILTQYPLYLLFYDNESGYQDEYFKASGGYWRHFYVKRFSPNEGVSKVVKTASANYTTYALTFKLVLSGQDLMYCRNLVFQFPLSDTYFPEIGTFHLGCTNVYVNVYDPVYDALTDTYDGDVSANIEDTKNAVNDVTAKQDTIDKKYNAEAAAYNVELQAYDSKSILTDNTYAFQGFWYLIMQLVEAAFPCFITLATCCILLGLALNTLGRR